MRIVQNLNDINECPNCTSGRLNSDINQFGRPFKRCPICTEEIYENEYTLSDEERQTTNRITELITNKELLEKQKKKDDFIF